LLTPKVDKSHLNHTALDRSNSQLISNTKHQGNYIEVLNTEGDRFEIKNIADMELTGSPDLIESRDTPQFLEEQ
jgi:hypothetical protein